VGVGTILTDDPSLRVHWELIGRAPGRSPQRVVLDSLGRTPANARILDGSAPTLIVTSKNCQRAFPPHVTTFQAGDRRPEVAPLLVHLHQAGVRNLMVEGGSAVIGSFLASGAFDRMTIYQSPLVIGDVTAPPLATFLDVPSPVPVIALRRTDLRSIDDGVLSTYTPSAAEASG
jgi:riboflavin-specific deaminase-like protein